MITKEYFPLGIAEGKAFCNRLTERKQLLANIQTGMHTLITSARRHGKSSIILFVLQNTKVLYADIDLFVTVDAKSVEKQLLKGVKQLVNKVSNTIEQTIHILNDYIKNLSSKWIIGVKGINIELIPEKINDPADTIMEALLMLDNLLSKKQTRAVLFIDEFQEIGEFTDCRGIEGAIRHIAQKTKYLTFIFSGSNRRMLLQMFKDRSRPLYKLCDHIILDKIATQHYIKHINHAAKLKWHKTLPKNILETIFSITERHPYYVNALCNKLWGKFDKITSAQEIYDTWQKYVAIERPNVIKELSLLSTSQLKLIIAIASGMQTKLTSKEFLSMVDLTSATVVQALNVLTGKDYIYLDEQKAYNLIDPLIKTTLQIHYQDYF
jgi:AAA+ ATPase superfamily predicted ATPase